MKLTREIVFKLAKGYRGRAKNCYSISVKRVMKGLQYAYRDRRTKKRNFKRQWIQKIQAGSNEHGLQYGAFINRLHRHSGIAIDRKILANLAENEPFSFRAMVEHVKDNFQVPVYAPRNNGLLYSTI